MNWRLTIILIAVMSSCQRSGSANEGPRITDPKKLAALREMFVPEAFVRPEDQKRAERLREGYAGPLPCAYDKIEGGVHEIASVPEYQCYKMTKPQRMTGLWRNEFEDRAFCAAPARECPGGKWRPNQPGVAWIDFKSPLPGSEDTPPGGLYAIDFVGRATAYPGHYGEYGFYNQDVIVDHVISIKMIKPPPAGQMTKEHIRDYLKDCDGKQICMPNSEVPRMK